MLHFLNFSKNVNFIRKMTFDPKLHILCIFKNTYEARVFLASIQFSPKHKSNFLQDEKAVV